MATRLRPLIRVHSEGDGGHDGLGVLVNFTQPVRERGREGGREGEREGGTCIYAVYTCTCSITE